LKNGVSFHSPDATEAIVPELLRTVWEEHNPQTIEQLLWEILNQGSVSGDSFVKIAFEESFVDPGGMEHPARIRILPLNSAFCLDEDTEILTADGWKDYATVQVDDLALCLDSETDEIRWEPVEKVNIFQWDGPVTKWSNDRFEAVSTDDHRWVVENRRSRKHQIRTTAELNKPSGTLRLVTGGGTPLCFSEVPKWSDELVELIGWFVTEGHIAPSGRQIWLTQDADINPSYAAAIRRLQHHFQQFGDVVEYDYGVRANQWRFGNEVSEIVLEAAPGKQITPQFLRSLTYAQAKLFYETLQAGDGGEHPGDGLVSTSIWYQSSTERIAGFQMLCGMLGFRTQAKYRDRLKVDHPYRPGNDCEGEVTVYSSRFTGLDALKKERTYKQGIMWCPTTSLGTWFARKKGVMPRGRSGREVCYWTGNCFP